MCDSVEMKQWVPIWLYAIVLCAACEDAAESNIDTPLVPPVEVAESFSFFFLSLRALQGQCGPNGCGGDLGGLQGADEICQSVATQMGANHKTWRAFLSVTKGPHGKPIHAIDRIGSGPWHDANGRLIAKSVKDLLHDRPLGDPQAINDLPDETGRGTKQLGDFHDALTGSNAHGRLNSNNPASTCGDWSSASKNVAPAEGITVGHSWPAASGQNWISAHSVPDCAPSISPGQGGVGATGGYGGFYCFVQQ